MSDEEGDNPTAEVSTTGLSPNWKVRGEIDATDAAGVLGYNSSGSGTTYGVEGTVDSSNSDAAGVRGVATASNGRASGVYGESNSSSNGAAGVYGYGAGAAYGVQAYSENAPGARVSTGEKGGRGLVAAVDASEGRGFGVYASADTEDDGSAGVNGISNASTGVTYGVKGTTFSGDSGAAGVRGINGGDGKTHGVEGVTYATDAGAAGVTGTADASTGQTYGIAGQTKSDHGDAAGVYAENSNAGPAVRAEGHVAVSDVGASAYLGSEVGISDATETKVPFDTKQHDDFGTFDTSTNPGEFNVPVAGDYHVSATVRWAERLSGQVAHKLHLRVDGTSVATRSQEVQGSASYDALVTVHLSKTIYGAQQGETITVAVEQLSSSKKDLAGSSQDQTYVTIDKVG